MRGVTNADLGFVYTEKSPFFLRFKNGLNAVLYGLLHRVKISKMPLTFQENVKFTSTSLLLPLVAIDSSFENANE